MSDDTNECEICFMDVDGKRWRNPCHTSKCNHTICGSCVLQLVKCPFCRQVYISEIHIRYHIIPTQDILILSQNETYKETFPKYGNIIWKRNDDGIGIYFEPLEKYRKYCKTLTIMRSDGTYHQQVNWGHHEDQTPCKDWGYLQYFKSDNLPPVLGMLKINLQFN